MNEIIVDNYVNSDGINIRTTQLLSGQWKAYASRTGEQIDAGGIGKHFEKVEAILAALRELNYKLIESA